jgi:putative transposase
MYNWRKMSDEDRDCVLKERKIRRFPWHSPPHFEYEGDRQFIITAACFEHSHIIGKSSDRMAECESELIEICNGSGSKLYAWCILPNHYHLLLRTSVLKELLAVLGKFHGASSFRWNGEDDTRGRKVWFRAIERAMRSERHFYATLNYIHHNPVKHGYAAKWHDWPYSSAAEYLEKVGREAASRIWNEYPVLSYGDEWDHD